MKARPACTAPEIDQGAQVAAYLNAHPGFLAERPHLLEVLDPPARVHGEALADHMVAMVGAARAKAARVLAAGRAAALVNGRVQEAVLLLLRSPDPVECVLEQWPGLLGVDAARLLCEGPRAQWHSLAVGHVRALLADRPILFRDRPSDAHLIHGEAASLAERDALIRIPGKRPGLLALACRDEAALPATHAWVFLGQVLGALTADD